MNDTEADRNLLFGVIAMQSGLITMQQFVDACTIWTKRKESGLAEVLIRQGWLLAEDRNHVDYLLQRRITKQGVDARHSLAAAPVEIRTALAGIGDPTIHESLQVADGKTESLQTIAQTSSPRLLRGLTLKGLHSTGGIGQVWIARDEMFGRDVALKELKANMAGSARNRDRFYREAQLTGQLEHPGIVHAYQYAMDDNRSYYTMRFVRGHTLSESLRDYHRRRKESAAAGTEQTFQELLESAPDAMVVVNKSGRIVLVNAQLERLFQFQREELLGQPIEMLVPIEHRAGHPAHVARFLASPDFRPMASGLKLRGCRKDGTEFPVEISLNPVRTEQGLLVSAAVRETTQR